MRPAPAFAAAAAATALAAAFAQRPAALDARGVRGRHAARARGAVHVHTEASADGTGRLEQVVRAARRAGLDFVVVTDHNTEASLGIDAWREGVLVLGGHEKSMDGGHALVLGLEALPFRLDGDPLEVVRDVRALGGFVLAAHPTSSHPEAHWSAGLTGVAGLEFLNLGQPDAWPGTLQGLGASVARYIADPQGALLRAFRFERAALELWDRALAERPIAGSFGSDAHGGVRTRAGTLPFPSHEQVFRLASQHLLLERPLRGELASDRAQVLAALRGGRGYGAFDALADASGFLFDARSGETVALMGDDLPLAGETVLRADADAPPGTALVLLRDGREVARGTPPLLHRTHEPGVFRVEAYLDPRLVPGGRALPWIVSNPIHVFPADVLAERARAAQRMPDPAPLAGRREVLDDFGGPLRASWQIDRAPDARAHVALEHGLLRFDFTLGPRAPTHVALCDYREQDLARAEGVVLRARASRPLRFDLQVRVAEADAPGGVRIWRRSLRADAEWRELSVRLSSLKTYDGRGGSPDLARVRGVYVQVDTAHAAPGASGTLWIDRYGLAAGPKE